MEGSSSPDPLNDSPAYTFNLNSRRTPRASASVLRTLPQHSSPKKQTFQLELGSELSPQKIRVTVEADDSDNENIFQSQRVASSPSRAPANRRGERTFTTTVPLKGLSDTEADTSIQYAATPRRPRGRPRKSATPVASKKRASTPASKKANKRKSVGELVDGDDEEDVDFSLSRATEVDYARRGSRSPSKGPGKPKASDNKTPKKRGRPRKSLPVQDDTLVEMLLDEHEGDFGNATSATSAGESNTTPEGDPIPDVVLARFHPGNETPKRTGWSSPRVIDSEIPSASRHRADSYPSPTESPAKTDSDIEFEDGDDNQDQDETQYMDEEDEVHEAGERREFDTIMESEEFSMISVDSVTSLREHYKSPADELQRTAILNRHLLAVQKNDTSFNDSFSSIPADILEAASPRKPIATTTLPTQRAIVDESFFSVSAETSKTPARPRTRSPEADQKYDNSFPDIPSTSQLAAAGRAYPPHVGSSLPARSNISLPRADSSPRLLTPEETPSPREHDIKNSSVYRKPSPSAVVDPSIVRPNDSPSQMRSSPPSVKPQRHPNSVHLKNQRHLDIDTTQTPSIIFSSPTLPPPPHQREHNESNANYEPSDRPTLSPIARTGRALQDVAVQPSSPRSRSQSLGSPFKSPFTDRRSSSAAPPPEPISMQDRLAEPHPRLVLSSQFMESSQRLRRLSSGQEDPFQNEEEKSPSPEQYRLGKPQSRQQSETRSLARSSRVDASQHDDAMSWQADEPSSSHQRPKSSRNLPAISHSRRYSLERDNVRVKSIALTNEQRWEAEREEVRKEISSANASRVITIESDDEEEEFNNDQGEDTEDFGLLLATLNSSSPPVQQNKSINEPAENSRRGKLPSPWKSTSKLLIASDELSQISSHRSPKSKPKSSQKSNLYLQPSIVQRVEAQAADDNSEADLSIWQIPQKSNFKPRARETGHLNLSAILTASPGKDLPVLAKDSQPPLIQKKATNNLAFLTGSRIQTNRASVSFDFSRSSMSGFAPIPQKMGFNSRPTSPAKQAVSRISPFDTSFRPQKTPSPGLSSSPALPAEPLAGSSTSKTNSLTAHHKDPSSPSISTPESIRSSQISILSQEQENQDTDHRTLDWAKAIHTANAAATSTIPPSSPTKSCFRRASSPSKAVAFVSSSPLPSSPPIASLSATTWTDAHYTLLKDIWLDWEAEREGVKGKGRRRNETRVVSRYLGKRMWEGGESMVLDQWHLEVVDEFRGEVPGWEERIVCMRLFSLILAADRRARRIRSP